MRFRVYRPAATLRLAALALTALPLVACSWLSPVTDPVGNAVAPPGSWFGADTGKCPAVEITGTLGSVSRFRGDSGNAANLTYRATLSNVSSTCSFTQDSVTISANVSLIAEIGPAATDRVVEFPYFIAVTGPGDHVFAKQEFRGPISFAANQRRSGVVDQLSETIPLKDLKASDRFHVMLGFQLAPEELAYNRAKGRVTE